MTNNKYVIKESYSVDKERTLYTRTKNFIVYGILPVFTGSFIIGALTGVVVALFMILVETLSELSKEWHMELIAQKGTGGCRNDPHRA